MPGSVTSAVEVTNIWKHGFWILIDNQEHFLPFPQFPWFAAATVQAILHVERPAPTHWPDLDVDLSLDSITHPARYPLTSKL